MTQPTNRRLVTEDDLNDEAALARNADNLTSGTVPDARIPAAIARDSEVTAAVAAEAALARDASNLTSGTVADARIASTIARDSEVTAAVAAEAALARDASNLTSGTIDDARIPSGVARDSEVTAAVATEASDRATADAAIQAQLDGKGTLAYAEKTTGTAALVTAFTTVAVPIPGMILTVEPTTADVWLRWGASLGISTVGAGLITMRLVEVFNDGTFSIRSGPIVREVAAGFVTAFGPTIGGVWRAGPITSTRQFYCDVILARESGSTLAAYTCDSYNNGAGAELAKTWMAAVAE